MLENLSNAITEGQKEFDLRKYAIVKGDFLSIKNTFANRKHKFAIDIGQDLYAIDTSCPQVSKQYLEDLKTQGYFIILVSNDQSTLLVAEADALLEELRATNRQSSALIFSIGGAIVAAAQMLDVTKDPRKFFTSKNYTPTNSLPLIATIGLIIGTANGFMGHSFNGKAMLAGIISADIACAGTCLASNMIENPYTKLAVAAAFLIAYTYISTKCLSSRYLAGELEKAQLN